MFFDFLNVVVGSGFDFLKGFVIGAIIGFVAYYFWDKHKLKAMQIQVDAIKKSAEIQINTLKEQIEATKNNTEIQINILKEQVDNYKSLLETEKQRHKHIEDNFKIIIADCLKQKSKQE